MLINTEQWRAGTFCGLIFFPTIQKSFVLPNHNLWIDLAKAPLNLNTFLSGLQDLLSNILCPEFQLSIVLGDLNARSPEW